jgi:hypothetical protein
MVPAGSVTLRGSRETRVGTVFSGSGSWADGGNGFGTPIAGGGGRFGGGSAGIELAVTVRDSEDSTCADDGRVETAEAISSLAAVLETAAVDDVATGDGG